MGGNHDSNVRCMVTNNMNADNSSTLVAQRQCTASAGMSPLYSFATQPTSTWTQVSDVV